VLLAVTEKNANCPGAEYRFLGGLEIVGVAHTVVAPIKARRTLHFHPFFMIHPLFRSVLLGFSQGASDFLKVKKFRI
jgi:hypothetical protein